MKSQYKNMIRVGRVSSINPATGTARVAFEHQGLVSNDLQVLVPQTLKNKDYFMPDIGEHVVCLFLPTGNQEGFILGSIYSNHDKPAVTDINKRQVKFFDGTRIEYDRSSHTLTVYAVGAVNIAAAGNVNITGDVNVTGNVNASGDVAASGISLINHVHKENDIGQTTEPPQ
ncbi:MAG: phage baseplate assembly protein V [Syntrophomonadaceae bacterium]|jgi:phage baseplate assembly protein V